MPFKKLKEVVAIGVNPDGSFVRNQRYQKSHTIDVHVETTGDLRLLVLVPEFMGDTIGGMSFGEGIVLTQVQKTKNSEKLWALVGRDPEALERAWAKVAQAYNKAMTTTKLTPMIRIAGNRDTFGRSYGVNKATIEIDFNRYLRNDSEVDKGVSKNDYEWNDECKPVKAMSSYRERGWTEVPYDERIWANLCNLRDQIREAQKRYEELVTSGDIAQRLLTGNLRLLGKSDD